MQGGLSGADRDWVSLANALGPAEIRLVWAGTEATENLRRHLDPAVLDATVDLGLPPFTYTMFDAALTRRSPWLWSKILGDYALRMRPALTQLGTIVEPDVVITNTAAPIVGSVFARRKGIPHWWCVKECLDRRIPAVRNHVRWIRAMSSKVVVPSRAARDAFGAGAEVIPDGSAVAMVERGAHGLPREAVLNRVGLPDAPPLIVQVGGNTPLKGAHILAAAYSRLCGERAGCPATVLFLGAPSPEYRKVVEKAARGAGGDAAGAVRFASFAPDDFDYLAAADIVVHPSVQPDSYPNAIREAMILGKPVIASRIGGIPEMIESGVDGILVEPDDPIGLANAIARLLDDAAFRRDLGSRAKAHARVRFDVRTTATTYSHMLREVAARRR